jgi:hypothetical protein
MSENDPIESPVTDPSDPNWFEGFVTDKTPPERVEFLKSFETPDQLFETAQSLKNRNWRDDFAGEDDKFKSQLERYNSPADLGKAFREQRSTISSGAFKQAPGADATPEDIAAYRQANGIPAEPTGYLENLPEGLVLGEDDKAIFSDFAAAMHEKNVSPDVMHKAIEWYNGFAEREQDALAELDHNHHQETEDQLRKEWGSDYRANINLVGSLIETTFGEEVAASILNARDMEGRAIMNIPGVLEGLAALSRKVNPVAQLTPHTGRSAVETLDEEIAGIEKLMRTNRKEYNADEKLQARYRELLQIRIDHNERKSA